MRNLEPATRNHLSITWLSLKQNVVTTLISQEHLLGKLRCRSNSGHENPQSSSRARKWDRDYSGDSSEYHLVITTVSNAYCLFIAPVYLEHLVIEAKVFDRGPHVKPAPLHHALARASKDLQENRKRITRLWYPANLTRVIHRYRFKSRRSGSCQPARTPKCGGLPDSGESAASHARFRSRERRLGAGTCQSQRLFSFYEKL